MKPKILTALLILVALLIVTSAWAVIVSITPRSKEKTVSTAGVLAIGDFGIYWELNCSNVATFIDWGTIDVGANSSVTVYVRHEGTVPFVLNYTLSNWNPANASDFITFSWDYDNRTLDIDNVMSLNLSVEVSPLTTGITNFSFDITVVSDAP